MDGWLKLHRQIITSSKFADPDILRLWILCLAKASHKPNTVIIEKKVIHLQPGQFVTGRYSLHQEYNSMLAPRNHVKDTTLWSWLKRLEQWGDLDIKSTNKFSVISVVKWHEYQDTLTTEPQQNDNRMTTEPQQTDTNKNVKNAKEGKEVKHIDVFSAYTTNPDLLESLKDFKDFRKQIKKPLTEKAAKLLINNLDKLSNDENEKVEILNQSIVNGWQSVYPLKNNNVTTIGGARHAEHGGRFKGQPIGGNHSAGTGTEQRESKVYPSRWGNSVV